jgi:SAM-dependent methyltransferase
MFDLEESYWWFVARRKLALDLLAEFAEKPVPPYDLLDLGCGTGILLSEAEGAWHGTGADFSPLALQFCRSRGLSRLVCADGTSLPLQSESVDVRLQAIGICLKPELDASELILPLLNDPSADVRRTAIMTLGPARDRAPLITDDELLNWLHDKDPEVR